MSHRVLCVDDDPSILDSYKRQLRKWFEVETAIGGIDGMARILNDEPYAVVVSDMRMPGMDGVQFLSRVRDAAPETVRIMLTGNVDLDTAIDAVNKGQVFRFLRKPCTADELAEALFDALSQRQSSVERRDVVEQLDDSFCPQDAKAGHATSSRSIATGVFRCGEQLGDYELLHEIGRGGMGAIYKARQTKLQSTVAIKILSNRFVQDSVAVKRFKREMELIAELNHPNVVRALDAREVDDVLFLVLEYVDGVDLSRILKWKTRLGIPEAAEVVRQAAQGMQYAHQRGVIHRDIKPANLILTEIHGTCGVKILDFGLARLQDEVSSTLTATGQMLGTVDYMAPELVEGSRAIDIRTDIYALGATFYELLSGQPPFGDSAHDTIVKKLLGLTHEPIVALDSLRPEVPKELAEIVSRMLAKAMEDRFREPREVETALTNFVTGADLSPLLKEVKPSEDAADTPASDSDDAVRLSATMELPSAIGHTK